MEDGLQLTLYAFTMDCQDPPALAAFYAALLRWHMPFHNADYAVIAPPDAAQGAYPGITFQRNPGYQPPVWPDAPGAQQQMAHLDFAVADLERAVAHALRCGATQAEAQFSEDWRVMLDPAGHPFCLCRMPQLFPTEA